MTEAESALRIALIHPELMGTYGDGGNATVLAQRARWRGLAAEVVSVSPRQVLPTSCDLYLLGGGEDDPQRHVARALAEGNRLARAVDAGAVVLAVCAGLQVLGHSFELGDGTVVAGLGLLDCRTTRPPAGARRAVGEAVVVPRAELGLPPCVGFENHGGLTTVDPAASAFGRCLAGIGNGTPDRADGVTNGRVLGTYLHGPVLALNPALADLLLGWASGSPLPPLAQPRVDEEAATARGLRLRLAGVAERPSAVGKGRPAAVT